MFFTLSKVLWFLVSPDFLLLAAILAGTVLLWSPWPRAGRVVVSIAAMAALVVATLPLGQTLIRTLEDRFPVVRVLPAHVDGIVALGGVVDQFVTAARGQVALTGAAERLTELAALARRYPDAKLVFTGGSGDLFRQDVKEADVIEPLLSALGLDPTRVIVESQSRNTHENAVLTHALAAPKEGETWLLVTSAFHMPRAIGCFRRAGWRVVAYPVDFNTAGNEPFRLSFNLSGGIAALGGGIHEWLGLMFYWLSGRTDALFPAPEG